MSELSNARLQVKKFFLIKPLPPLVTLVLAPIAFVLALLALVSEGNNGMRGNYVVALNTTNLLKDVLKVQPVASPSVAATSINPMITPPPEIAMRQLFPEPGKVGSFFNSVGSDIGGIGTEIQSKISTALNPTGTAAAGGLIGEGGLLGGGETDGLGNLFGENGTLSNLFEQGPLRNLFGNGTLSKLFDGNGTLSNLFDGNGTLGDLFKDGPLGDLFNSLGGQAASLLVRLVNKLAESAVDSLGLADQYSLYMREYCSANVTASTQQMGSQACSALRQISIASPSNSTIQIGNMMVDYSALNIPNKLSGTGPLITTLFDAIFAFQVIGIVGTGLVFLLAIPLVFISSEARILRLSAGLVATIASIFLLAVSLIQIIIAVAVPNIVNPLGEGLGVDARRSTNFVAFVTVSSVFSSIIALVWTIHNFWTWHDKKYVARSLSGMNNDYDTPLASGRPIIKLNSSDDDNVREKGAVASEIPAALRIPRFGKMRTTIRKPASGSTLQPSDSSPEEPVYSPRAPPKEYKPYRPPANRLTVG